MSHHVHIVINPEAGRPEPVLAVLHGALRPMGLSWDVCVVKAEDHLPTLVHRALDAGADVVAAYGGDGTVAGVAEGLIGTGVPLAVLPGGTANVFSAELGLGADLAAACHHLRAEAEHAPIDVIALGCDRHAVLHVGAGFPACAIALADRAAKDGLGALAYTVAGLETLLDPPHSRYRLVLDGNVVETEGTACMICNGGGIGQGGLSLSPAISVSDGWLDVVVIRNLNARTLLGLTRDLVLGREPASDGVQRWRARTIEVTAEPAQRVQSDGNAFGETPIRARVKPRALRVLVPSPATFGVEVA